MSEDLVVSPLLAKKLQELGGFDASAFTSSELDNMLPEGIRGGESFGEVKWQYSFRTEFQGKTTLFQSRAGTGNSEVNAKAGLLIRLLEEGYYTKEKTI